jgi:hypothetical protein
MKENLTIEKDNTNNNLKLNAGIKSLSEKLDIKTSEAMKSMKNSIYNKETFVSIDNDRI